MLSKLIYSEARCKEKRGDEYAKNQLAVRHVCKKRIRFKSCVVHTEC